MPAPTAESLMRRAIATARAKGTPYGAAIHHLHTGQTLLAANSTRADGDPSAHAEINAIREAGRRGWLGADLWLVSTCEPCPMCAMAAVWAGIGHITFGAGIDDAARFGHQVRIYCEEVASKAWYDLKVEGGVLRADCLALFRGKP